MKLFNKTALFALAGLAFIACSEQNDWTPGVDVTDTNKNYSNVSFERSSKSVECEPEDPTTMSIYVVREKTENEETVPIEILANTDDMFQVGECVFAAGEDKAEVVIDFSKAEVGKNYSMKLALTDRNHVSEYTQANTMTVSVVRAKWVPIEGKGKLYADIIKGKNESVEIQMRSDDPTCFRIVDPFAPMILRINGVEYKNSETAGYTGADEYLKFRVMKVGEDVFGTKVTRNNLVNFDEVRIGRGDFVYGYGADVSFRHPSIFASFKDETTWMKNCVMEWLEEPKADKPGMPGKIQLAPIYYLEGLGGIDCTQDNGQIAIFFPGYTEPAKADITQDFDWDEEVFAGEFISEQLGTTTGNSLYRGTCTLTTDDADKVFKQEWGTAYAIPSPYAEGYDLYFTVTDDGYIMLPEEVALQPIGLEALGEDVYAKINVDNSTIDLEKKQLTLNITFCNRDGSKVYATTNESLQLAPYTTVGTADWEYIFFGDENAPYLDEGLTLQRHDEDPSSYRILHALNDVTILFTINEDNTVTINRQETGAEAAPGTPIYVMDMYSFDEEADPSVYNPETSTISAYLLYHYINGNNIYGGDVVETIKLNFDEQPAESAKAKKLGKAFAAKKLRSFAKNVRSPWANYKKVDNKKTFEPLVLR